MKQQSLKLCCFAFLDNVLQYIVNYFTCKS